MASSSVLPIGPHDGVELCRTLCVCARHRAPVQVLGRGVVVKVQDDTDCFLHAFVGAQFLDTGQPEPFPFTPIMYSQGRG